jgi:hypothetical protein
MLRKVVSAAVILVLCVGVALAEEMRVFITKVDGDKITFQENKGKGEKGDAKTLTADAKVKVSKGKYDKDTKKTEATEAISDGLKDKMFSSIDSEKGIQATITTDKDNKKITEIIITKGKGKGKQ